MDPELRKTTLPPFLPPVGWLLTASQKKELAPVTLLFPQKGASLLTHSFVSKMSEEFLLLSYLFYIDYNKSYL